MKFMKSFFVIAFLLIFSVVEARLSKFQVAFDHVICNLEVTYAIFDGDQEIQKGKLWEGSEIRQELKFEAENPTLQLTFYEQNNSYTTTAKMQLSSRYQQRLIHKDCLRILISKPTKSVGSPVTPGFKKGIFDEDDAYERLYGDDYKLSEVYQIIVRITSSKNSSES